MDDKPIDATAALGIPNPQGAQVPPPQVAMQVLQLACKYLLYERSEETVMTVAFAQLAEERHQHFHVRNVYLSGPHKGKQVTFAECSNAVCADARNLLTQTRSKEIYINPIAAQLMQDYGFNFMPMPANLRVWISKISEQLPATENTRRRASSIVLTD